ncbi:MAG: putative prokaryotic signal transducing protein [Chloroflexi bacterium]|nr:putative prokaryotic signal transducing protein [Chloroflexota bacterium]MDB5076125.1 putative prokaryotic signal transducing protein [Chloroflexota bacterium]
MQENHWTQVRTTSSHMEAEMLRDLLEKEGITGLVQTSDASAYLGVMSPCRLLVRQADAARAAAFLDAWEEGQPEPNEPHEYEDGRHE